MLRLYQALTCIIMTFYCNSLYSVWKEEVSNFFQVVLRLEGERGLPFVVMYVKNSRTAITRVISGRPLDVIDLVALKDGWPVWLAAFRPLIQTTEGRRFLMTLITSLRGIHLKPVLDLSPIISPWKGSLEAINITSREFSHVCRQLGIKWIRTEFRDFHMSTKRGPLGQALLTSVTELTLIPQEILSDIKLIGGVKLGEAIDALLCPRLGGHSIADIWKLLFPARRTSLRKISYFADKEGKTRVIAILDFWSQSALRPLHDALNSILRKIPSDCTFNQNHFLTCLPSVGPYFSIDLSNATDRIPVALQRLVIERVIGKERADAWVRTLTGWEFSVSGGPSGIKYQCGQPIGAYSSWCAMALTHHFLVKLAALRAGKPHYRQYALLGDDLVLTNADVATEYRKLLAHLDMPISEQKTHSSNDVYEFAKRWIHTEGEFTGFAISGLREVWKRYSLLHNFLETQRHHGWIMAETNAPDLIRALYFLMGRPTQVERVIKLYKVFDLLAKAKKTGVYAPILFGVDDVFFGFLVTSHLSSVRGGETLDDISKEYLTEAKRRLVERDLEVFQKDAYVVNSRLNKDFESLHGQLYGESPGLSGQDYRAVLREYHPLVRVLNNLIDGSIASLMLVLGEDSQEKRDFYLTSGLSKYFVSKGVFSMRASHSINLAESMVVKSYINVVAEVAKAASDASTIVGPTSTRCEG